MQSNNFYPFYPFSFVCVYFYNFFIDTFSIIWLSIKEKMKETTKIIASNMHSLSFASFLNITTIWVFINNVMIVVVVVLLFCCCSVVNMDIIESVQYWHRLVTIFAY